MAARSSPSMKHPGGYRLFSPAPTTESLPPTAADEFDESDVWGTGDSWACEPKKPFRVSGRRKSSSGPATTTASAAAAAGADSGGGSGGSMPMNIPDWSKILLQEYQSSSSKKNVGVGWEEEEYGTVIPPHELLWRSRAASLSVQEGIGRTLKGRDLSRVRNAIWAKTGFQD